MTPHQLCADISRLHDLLVSATNEDMPLIMGMVQEFAESLKSDREVLGALFLCLDQALSNNLSNSPRSVLSFTQIAFNILISRHILASPGDKEFHQACADAWDSRLPAGSPRGPVHGPAGHFTKSKDGPVIFHPPDEEVAESLGEPDTLEDVVKAITESLRREKPDLFKIVDDFLDKHGLDSPPPDEARPLPDEIQREIDDMLSPIDIPPPDGDPPPAE